MGRLDTYITTNLSAVTVATNGTKVDTSMLSDSGVWINVSVNTGAVTVTIEASYSGAFAGEEVALDTKTYTATTGTDLFTYDAHFQFMRVTTTTQSNSTVTAVITGRQE
jgi:hypothetical protein